MKTKARNCPVCNSDNLFKWFTKIVLEQKYEYMKCANCSHVFVSKEPNIDWESIYTSKKRLSKRESRDFFLQTRANELLNPNSTKDADDLFKNLSLLGAIPPLKLLDVGAGLGFISEQALELVYEVISIEPSEYDCSILENIKGLKIDQSDFLSSKYRKVDIVIFSHVLEHLMEPDRFIKKCREILNDGGIVVISVPNQASILSRISKAIDPMICPPAHLSYFSIKSLEKLMLQNSFSKIFHTSSSRFQNNSIVRKTKNKYFKFLVKLPFLVINLLASITNSNQSLTRIYRIEKS